MTTKTTAWMMWSNERGPITLNVLPIILIMNSEALALEHTRQAKLGYDRAHELYPRNELIEEMRSLTHEFLVELGEIWDEKVDKARTDNVQSNYWCETIPLWRTLRDSDIILTSVRSKGEHITREPSLNDMHVRVGQEGNLKWTDAPSVVADKSFRTAVISNYKVAINTGFVEYANALLGLVPTTRQDTICLQPEQLLHYLNPLPRGSHTKSARKGQVE